MNNDDICSLLRYILDKSQSEKIVWIYRPNPNGGIAYSLSGQLKFARINDTYHLFYCRVGKQPTIYTLIKGEPGWFLAAQLYLYIATARSGSHEK